MATSGRLRVPGRLSPRRAGPPPFLAPLTRTPRPGSGPAGAPREEPPRPPPPARPAGAEGGAAGNGPPPARTPGRPSFPPRAGPKSEPGLGAAREGQSAQRPGHRVRGLLQPRAGRGVPGPRPGRRGSREGLPHPPAAVKPRRPGRPRHCGPRRLRSSRVPARPSGQGPATRWSAPTEGTRTSSPTAQQQAEPRLRHRVRTLGRPRAPAPRPFPLRSGATCWRRLALAPFVPGEIVRKEPPPNLKQTLRKLKMSAVRGAFSTYDIVTCTGFKELRNTSCALTVGKSQVEPL
ncbi:basic salivary proline-rich protein 1-like [Lemur catta]|uniref:basic salivary proline-rich protein 1-like n=1 Tax=Lemur catta TaxID=9447 RepID=UPI001E26D27C|nr:basic salivary proline-rich protein 1-like [Lemur catta]